MKSFVFVAIVLISGSVAGTIHGVVNLGLVEPYLDEAIGIENKQLFSSGEEKDTPQFWVEYNSYRDWQKSGQILAGAILGTSIGALFGIVFVYSKNSLPGQNNVKKALILAGIMWLTIYLIPFLKYPANPPTVGETDTVILRGALYLGLIAISGFSALGFYKLSKIFKGKNKIISILGYAALIGVVFLIIPENPDKVTAPQNLVEGFRMMSILAVSSFWLVLPIVFGALWNKFKPDKQLEAQTQ